jgi:hypothetical protein
VLSKIIHSRFYFEVFVHCPVALVHPQSSSSAMLFLWHYLRESYAHVNVAVCWCLMVAKLRELETSSAQLWFHTFAWRLSPGYVCLHFLFSVCMFGRLDVCMYACICVFIFLCLFLILGLCLSPSGSLPLSVLLYLYISSCLVLASSPIIIIVIIVITDIIITIIIIIIIINNINSIITITIIIIIIIISIIIIIIIIITIRKIINTIIITNTITTLQYTGYMSFLYGLACDNPFQSDIASTRILLLSCGG